MSAAETYALRQLIELEKVKLELRMVGATHEEINEMVLACVSKSQRTQYSFLTLLNFCKDDFIRYGKQNLSLFIYE